MGSGCARRELEGLSERLGLTTSVRFLGEITNEDELLGFFENAVAYISPGSVGLGVLHAFAFGVPVATCRGCRHGPEYEWIRDGVNGLCMEPSVSEIATALRRLWSDSAYAAALGKQAYTTYMNEASPQKMVDGFRLAIESGRSVS
ncbi:MAG: glycosyltransferase [Opitutaceae bacterium]